MNTTTRRPRDPKLRTHKQSGRQYATFDGRPVWFGHKSDPETQRQFDVHLARWLANGRREPGASGAGTSGGDLAVREVVARYREHLARLRPPVFSRRSASSPAPSATASACAALTLRRRAATPASARRWARDCAVL